MVLAKVGFSGFALIASMSARRSARAASSAGPKCAGSTRSNGGTPSYGPVQGASNGLAAWVVSAAASTAGIMAQARSRAESWNGRRASRPWRSASGDDVHPAASEAAHVAPARGHQVVRGAVAVDVAHAGGVEAERLAGDAAGEGAQHSPVLAGEDVDLAARRRPARV